MFRSNEPAQVTEPNSYERAGKGTAIGLILSRSNLMKTGTGGVSRLSVGSDEKNWQASDGC